MDTRREHIHEIAVVIPTRDRWPLLRIALGCALAQRDVDVHVVVVDDGSVDATRRELEVLDDKRLQVLHHNRPQGVAAARNLGLAHVKAPWVAFLDDDDVWAPCHLAAMLDAVRRAEVDADRVGLVFGGCLQIDANWDVTHVLPAPATEAARGGMNSFNSVGCPSRVLLRTEAARTVGGFDERLAIVADWDLWVRIVKGYEIIRSPDLLVAYRVHNRNMHLDGDRYLEDLALIQQKYGWSLPTHSGTYRRFSRPLAGDIAPGFVASAYRARGRRLQSARWYLRSFRVYGRRRDLGRAVGVLLGERVIDFLGLRDQKRPDPSAGSWLHHVRRAASATTHGLPPVGTTQCQPLEFR